MRISKGAALSLSVLSAVAVALPSNAGGNKYESVAASRTCGDDSVNWLGALKLWPPNHKYVPSTIVATGDDGESVTLDVMPDYDESAMGGDGGPQHDPDWEVTDSPANTGTKTATVDLKLRAERSGQGDGRVYTVDWTAVFGGEECSSLDGTTEHAPFVVTVPHDMRGGADWK